LGTPLKGEDFSSSSDEAFSAKVAADTQPRIRIDAGGRITWGSGSAAGDVYIYRYGENIIKFVGNVAVDRLFVDGIEIDTTGAASNQILRFDGTKFAPHTSVLDDLGDVVITSATNGQILEYDGTNWVNTVRPSNEPMGFENANDSFLDFDKTTRIFTIEPTDSSFTVWVSGKRFVKTAPASVTIPNVSGMYTIYYNSSGVLSYKDDAIYLPAEAPIAYIYWNSADATDHIFADERHGVTMDWATHEYLHKTRGAAIAEGFGANNYSTTGNGSSDAHAKIDIANGVFFDEDLKISITHSDTPGYHSHEQVLQGGAEIPMLYRTNTHFRKDAATKFPMKQGTARVAYNYYNAGVWSTPDISNNKFGVTFIVATNDLHSPIIGVLGQAEYTDQGSAEAAKWEDLVITDLPLVEWRPLYKIVYQTATAYANTPHARITAVIDMRIAITSAGTVPTTPVTDHGSMTGLTDDDHTQYLTDTRHDALDHSTAMGSVVLDDISNVTVPSPSSGDFLKWNGTAWVNDGIDLGTDTTGNYVSDISGSSPISVAHTPAEGSSATVSLALGYGDTQNPYNSKNPNLVLASPESSMGAPSFRALTTTDIPYPGSANQIIYKNGSNVATGSSGLTYDGTDFSVSGKIKSTASSGEEGGEIFLAQPQSNNTLSGGVTIDLYQNRLRFFEQGGSARGFYIDITGGGAGVSTNLASAAAPSLDGLNDVTAPSPSSGDFLKWNGTAWVNDAIDLGTDTSGSYVQSLVAGTGITLANNSGEGATPTISIGQAVGSTDSPTFAGVTLDSIRIGITDANEIDTTSGNLTIDSAGGTVTIDDNLTVSGNLTVNGTTTTVNSTTITVDDPIITLGGDTAPSSDDNKDRGVEFRYHNGAAAKVGFFGYDDSTGRFVMIPDATNSSEVFSGTVGDIQAGTFFGALSGNASTASALQTSRTIALDGDITGSASFDGSGNVTITTNIASDAVTLGFDTNGNYVASILGGTGISVSVGLSEGATPTISLNATLDNLSDVSVPSPTSGEFLKWNGTAWSNYGITLGSDTTGSYVQSLVAGTGVTITNNSGEGATPTVAIGQAVSTTSNVTFADVTVTGNLSVTGSTFGSATLDVDNYKITLNASVTGAPTLNGEIEVNRGTSPDVRVRWNESLDIWEYTNDGSTYSRIGSALMTVSDTPPSSPYTGDLWFESDSGITFVRYDSHWIEIGASGIGAVTSDTAPSNPANGQVWFESDTNQLKIYYSGSWIQVGGADAVNVINAINAKGDLIVGTANDTVTRLGVGANNYVLTANSSTTSGLEWVSRAAIVDDFAVASIMGAY
jgi:hypothetical protein